MAWVYLFGLTLVLGGACGCGIGDWPPELGVLDAALRIHLIAAPVIAFLVSVAHRLLAPDFDAVLRAIAMTGIVVALDVTVVAPIFERSYAMFRSAIGTWLPFGAIFVASLAAGLKPA